VRGAALAALLLLAPAGQSLIPDTPSIGGQPS
jgi:hypothetical protein